MLGRRLGAGFLCTSALLLGSPSSAAEEIYRRAVVLEDAVGRVELREAFGARLTVLGPCAAGPHACPETRPYDYVARLDFLVEHRSRSDGAIARSRSDRGTILLALAARPADLVSYRDLLEADVGRLAAEAFAQPFAGWEVGDPPLDVRQFALRSEGESWVCLRSEQRVAATSFHRLEREDEAIRIAQTTYDDPPTPICDEMASATEGAAPRVFETMPSPARVLELVVEHQDVIRLDDDPSTLLPVPQGILVYRQEVPARIGREFNEFREENAYGEVVRGGRRTVGFARPASIPLDALDRNAWLHRFTARALDRRLGRNSRQQAAGRFDLHVAYLPVAPACRLEPVPEGGEPALWAVLKDPPPCRERWPPSFPSVARERLLEAIAAVLERDARPPADLLEELVLEPAAGLESEDWIAVACREDGTAAYSIPPTHARARVVNAGLFCGALASRVGETRGAATVE